MPFSLTTNPLCYKIRLHLMAHRPIGYLGDEVQRFGHYGIHRRLHLRSVKLVTDGAFVNFALPGYDIKHRPVSLQELLVHGVLQCMSHIATTHRLQGSLLCLWRLSATKFRSTLKPDGK